MKHIPDAPYIQNYMATGEEHPRPYNRELERLEERLETLESERRAVERFECLSFDLKEEAVSYYNTEIACCKLDMKYQEGR